jgi:hypothetical protein
MISNLKVCGMIQVDHMKYMWGRKACTYCLATGDYTRSQREINNQLAVYYSVAKRSQLIQGRLEAKAVDLSIFHVYEPTFDHETP